jgi:hypothetical protein
LRQAIDTQQYVSASTGGGKTYLACALVQQPCREGLAALYVRAGGRFDKRSVCHAEDRFHKCQAGIGRTDTAATHCEYARTREVTTLPLDASNDPSVVEHVTRQ